MKKVSIFALILIFAACQNQLYLETSPIEKDCGVKSIYCDVPSIEFPQSKSIIGESGSFSWREGDIITIWPSNNFLEDGSVPISVPFKSKSTGSSAQFIGNGWGLLRGETYYIAYPFSNEDTYNSVGVNYSNQSQSENGSTEHIGEYDYLFASSTVPTSGDVNFEFQRIGVLMKCVFNVPKEVLFKKLEVIAPDKCFIRSAKYNPRDENLELTDLNYSKVITVKLGSNGLYANDSGEIIVYFMMSPVSWSGKEITFALVDNNSFLYEKTTTPSRDQVAGKGYSSTFNLEKSSKKDIYGDVVDLGLKVCWSTKNVGAESPEEYGGFYAWGETKAYGEEDPTNFMNLAYTNNDPIKTYYGPETYKFWTSDKYSSSAKTLLDWDDDVAYTEMDMRMPDQFDWEELCDSEKVIHTYTNDYDNTGVAGTIITSIVPGYEGASIFIPSMGYRNRNEYFNEGVSGFYWAKDILQDKSIPGLYPHYIAFSQTLNTGTQNPCLNGNPYLGQGVRPVEYSKNVVRKVVIVEELEGFSSLDVDEEYTLNAKVLRTSYWVSKEVTWSTTNSDVISIEETGTDSSFEMSYAKIKALASGSATIKAVSVADESEVGTIKITVN